MHATVATATPAVGPYKIPEKPEKTEKRPNRGYRRQAELGLCDSPCEWDAPISRASSSFSTVVETNQKRVIRSPRCTIPDDRIFPSDHAPYQDANSRWHCISEQAGEHRQDGSVMTITRSLSPQAVRKGLTKHAASRIKCLNLWLDHNEDILPEWLDVIADVLVNLQHLTLSQDVFPGEEDITVSARMRRLYVLYRLPFLKSIDDEPVSREERRLSSPNDPNGERVQRDDWVGDDALLDEDDEDEAVPCESDDDSAPQLAVTESIGNQTATELGAEIQELTKKVVALNEIEDDDYSDTLTGIELVDMPLNNSSGSGEAREDRNSDTISISDRDGDTTKLQTPKAVDAGATDLSGPARSATQRRRPNIQLDENNLSDHGSSRSLPGEIRASNTYELLSVASSSHEWTAACGVLAFRRDRACAPRLRMPFCGRNLKQVADDGGLSAREKAKKALRERKNAKNLQHTACSPVQRQSVIVHSIGDMPSKNSAKFFPKASADQPQKFFPLAHQLPGDEPSANKKIPPSKSLSSPFPMQFRERTKPKLSSLQGADTTIREPSPGAPMVSPRIDPSSPMETITGPLHGSSFSPSYRSRKELVSPRSPAKAVRSPSKGDLPPPCPGGRRKVPVPATASALQSRKARKMARKLKASKENARGMSVFDMDDDDEYDGDESDSDEEADSERSNQYD